MAKLVKIGNMVLIEHRRDTNRDNNTIYIGYKLQPAYGQPFTKEAADSSRVFTVSMEARVRPDLWENFKDLSRDDTLEKAFEELLLFKSTTESGDAVGLATIRQNMQFYGLTEALFNHLQNTPSLKDQPIVLQEA